MLYLIQEIKIKKYFIYIHISFVIIKEWRRKKFNISIMTCFKFRCRTLCFTRVCVYCSASRNHEIGTTTSFQWVTHEWKWKWWQGPFWQFFLMFFFFLNIFVFCEIQWNCVGHYSSTSWDFLNIPWGCTVKSDLHRLLKKKKKFQILVVLTLYWQHSGFTTVAGLVK